MVPTYSMVQSPCWEANWFAASQEIPSISRNPKVHYRTHKRPPPVAILGQPNPAHIPTSHLLKIHPNIIRPSTPRSPQWSPSLRFPHQDPIHPPLFTHMHHMPSPSHSSRHPHNIGWGVQIIWLLIMQSPPFPHYLVPPRSKYSPQHYWFSITSFNKFFGSRPCMVLGKQLKVISYEWNMTSQILLPCCRTIHSLNLQRSSFWLMCLITTSNLVWFIFCVAKWKIYWNSYPRMKELRIPVWGLVSSRIIIQCISIILR